MLQKLFFHPHSSLRGFSLVELLVAMFIFALLFMVLVMIYARATKAHGYARHLQDGLEQTQVAINLVSKSVRTGHVISPVGTNSVVDGLYIYDASAQRCIRYYFSNDSFYRSMTATGIASHDMCPNITSLTETSSMLNIPVRGGFVVHDTQPRSFGSDSSVDAQMGAVEVFVSVYSSPSALVTPSFGEPVHLQTTVSLRNYSFAGL
ncbi:MAG: prepilin-type N-terminal cleavage/methylation domain-containing protein [Candidatus Moranbacteria bacterium]|nr:prepilin-type N-terminal cleavage/methylation domain-containing protein [Candidatus Moranbacteria bacterium]